MISKDRLLAGLNEVIYVEEGMVTMYAKFSQALVAQTEDIDKDTKNTIRELLSKLHRDSSRHKEIVDKMFEEVEGGIVNEY